MTRHYKTTLMWRTQNWDNSYISKCGPKRGARPTLAENLLTKTHQQEKLNLTNVASKDTTLRSTQVFSTLPYTYGENENMEIWKYFFWKKLEILNVIFVPKF